MSNGSRLGAAHRCCVEYKLCSSSILRVLPAALLDEISHSGCERTDSPKSGGSRFDFQSSLSPCLPAGMRPEALLGFVGSAVEARPNTLSPLSQQKVPCAITV